MTASPDHAEVPHLPELAADYEILGELGRGRQSVVYLARERELGRLVSIKLLQAQYSADEEAAASLVREARTLGGLQHPGILTLYGTRRLNERVVALVREYLPGTDLRSELREKGPLPLARAHQVLAELADALAYLHHRQLLHRNLRPEHVLLEEDTSHVRLSGFSSPPAFRGPAGASFAREALDSAAYMAPEQLAGGPEDPRTDIYALGVLGYELLTGQTPWPDASLFTIVERRLHDPAPSPGTLRPEVPTGIRRAVESALHSDPAERWGTAESFRVALGDAPPEILPEPVAAAAAPGGAHADPFPMMPGAHDESVAIGGARPNGLRLHRKGKRRLVRAAWALSLLAVAAVVWRVATDLAVSPDPSLADGDLWSGTASAPPATGLPREEEFAASAPGSPAVAYVLSGDAQEGAVGDTLRQWLALRVEDAAGRPVQGVQVRFEVTQGDGVVTPETGATDEYGVAGARLVPQATGAHVVEAIVARLEDHPTVFRATARSRADSAVAPPEAAPPPRVEAVRAGVSAGGMHSCALDADGVASCWGGNDNGQLGDGSAQRRASPVRVAAPEALASLYAGVAHSCGLGVSGNVFCWGANSAGQLGDGTRSARLQPVRVATDVRLVTLGTGSAHSCGLDAAGRVHCWGQNNYGQLGDGSRTGRTAPVAVAGGGSFRSLAVGWNHTCGLTADGAAWCWGRNQAGQLGDGSASDRAEPTAVAGGQRFTAIAAGSAHTCALTSDGAAWCWGQNTHGQLGTGSRQGSPTPAQVAGDDRFRTLAVGGVHTCGITRAGLARCWGRNTYGQLGDGTDQDRTSPVAVQGGLRFTALHASGAHTCGTAAGGIGYCWGYNLEGQLGDGTRTNQRRPVAVIGDRQ